VTLSRIQQHLLRSLLATASLGLDYNSSIDYSNLGNALQELLEKKDWRWKSEMCSLTWSESPKFLYLGSSLIVQLMSLLPRHSECYLLVGTHTHIYINSSDMYMYYCGRQWFPSLLYIGKYPFWPVKSILFFSVDNENS